jgi:hypothetical protein
MAKENQEEMVQQPTSRQRLAERFKGRNPELNVEDDEALGAAILGELDNYDRDAERMRRFNETVSNSDIAPEMMAGILSGKNADGTPFSIEEYLLDNNIDFLLDYIEDSATAKEKMAKRKEEREKQKKADDEFNAKKQQLIEAEDAELDAAVAEMGYKPEQVADLIDWIYNKENGLIKRAVNYELKKDDFLRLFKIKDYDVRMADAEDRGYKRGKNEKIDMFRRQQKKRDDMPADIGGGGGVQVSQPENADDDYLNKLKKMKRF